MIISQSGEIGFEWFSYHYAQASLTQIQTTLDNKLIRISVLTDHSCASSMIITEYHCNIKSLSNSFRRIPSVISLTIVEVEQWVES